MKKLKCLYIYDNKFVRKYKKIYSEGRITDEVFRRYVTDEDKITVISRMREVENIDKFSLITLKNLKFIPLKGTSFSKAFTYYQINNLIIISKELKNSDFLVTRLPSFIGIYGLLINTIYKKKYFIEVVGDAHKALLTSKENPKVSFKVFSYIFFKLNQYFIRNADGVIYVTEKALQKKYPTQGFSGYASNVDIEIDNIKISRENYYKSDKFFKVGLIGDYNNHYKGIKEAINATRLINDQGFNINLHILGSGSLLSEYKNLAETLGVSNLVHFEGRLKGNDRILNWLRMLDVYIQPSYTEGLPRALIEAMSVGLPAVATDVGGVPELLSEDAIIKPYNSSELSEKILRFLNSKELRYKHGLANYKKSKNYDRKVLKNRRSIFWEVCKDIVRQSI